MRTLQACRDFATRLEQVVWNLLTNAIKFTPEGGRIHVAISVLDGQARLVVSDTGQGIDPAFLPGIFDMFGQAPGRSLRGRSGLGIGLALVRQLVTRHGGRIAVASDGPGRGTTFTVWLPTLALAQPTEHVGAKPAGARRCNDPVIFCSGATFSRRAR